MPRVVTEVVVRQQHLANVLSKGRKQLTVGGHQPRLPDRRAGLQVRKISRTPIVSQRAHPCTDRAGTHYYNFAAGLALNRQLGYQLPQLRQIGLPPRIGQHSGPQLHHDTSG